MCEEPECADCFVAFETAEELRRHHLERHSGAPGGRLQRRLSAWFLSCMAKGRYRRGTQQLSHSLAATHSAAPCPTLPHLRSPYAALGLQPCPPAAA